MLTNMSNYDESKHLEFDESGLCIFSIQPNGRCFCSICEDNVETSEKSNQMKTGEHKANTVIKLLMSSKKVEIDNNDDSDVEEEIQFI